MSSHNGENLHNKNERDRHNRFHTQETSTAEQRARDNSWNPQYSNPNSAWTQPQTHASQYHSLPYNPYIQQGMYPAAARSGTPFSHSMQTHPDEHNFFGTTPGERFLRGLVLGGAVTYLLTNETAQKAIMKTCVKLSEAVSTGMEELKEKFMDVKSEVDAEKKGEQV